MKIQYKCRDSNVEENVAMQQLHDNPTEINRIFLSADDIVVAILYSHCLNVQLIKLYRPS